MARPARRANRQAGPALSVTSPVYRIDRHQRRRRQSIATSVGAYAGLAGTPGLARSIGITTLQSFGSARFLAGEQLADRAEKFRLWATPFGHPLGVEASPQAKTRRLGRITTPAVLAAAHSSAALLHRSSLTQPAGPDDPEVDPTCGDPEAVCSSESGSANGSAVRASRAHGIITAGARAPAGACVPSCRTGARTRRGAAFRSPRNARPRQDASG